MRRKVLAITLTVVLVLAISVAVVGNDFITGIAEENLSNAEFSRDHTVIPSDLGLAAHDIELATSDGLSLAAWWIPAPVFPNTDATVILVHGLAANMSKTVERWGPNLHGAGYNILAFDLRNHGGSDDGPDGYVSYGATEHLDVLAAVDHVRSNSDALGVDPDRIVLYGASMGAASALVAAAQSPDGVQAVIFDSGFASLRFQAAIDGAEKGYPQFLIDMVVGKMERKAPGDPSSVAADAIIGDVSMPILLAHCANDGRVEPASHERLASLAPDAETWFQECPEGLSEEFHVDGWMLADYNETVIDFIGRNA